MENDALEVWQIHLEDNQELPDFLICMICTNLVMNPIECTECHRVFCVGCINTWRRNKDYCPSLCKKMKYDQVHPFVKQSLAKLMAKCPYKGCSEVSAYEKYKEHLYNCKFN